MVTLKYLKQVAKGNIIKNYSKLQKEALQTLLRERLPLGVFVEEIETHNWEEIVRRLNGYRASKGAGTNTVVGASGLGPSRSVRTSDHSLLDSNNPEINVQTLQPTHYVLSPPRQASKKASWENG